MGLIATYCTEKRNLLYIPYLFKKLQLFWIHSFYPLQAVSTSLVILYLLMQVCLNGMEVFHVIKLLQHKKMSIRRICSIVLRWKISGLSNKLSRAFILEVVGLFLPKHYFSQVFAIASTFTVIKWSSFFRKMTEVLSVLRTIVTLN